MAKKTQKDLLTEDLFDVDFVEQGELTHWDRVLLSRDKD